MNVIHAKQAKDLIDSGQAILLDIREEYEREICKVDSSWIPMAEVKSRVEDLPKDTMVFVLCRTGKRAEAVANMLIVDYGMSNIAIIEGGIIGWNDAHELNLDLY